MTSQNPDEKLRDLLRDILIWNCKAFQALTNSLPDVLSGKISAEAFEKLLTLCQLGLGQNSDLLAFDLEETLDRMGGRRDNLKEARVPCGKKAQLAVLEKLFELNDDRPGPQDAATKKTPENEYNSFNPEAFDNFASDSTGGCNND